MVRLKLFAFALIFCTFIPFANANIVLTNIHGEKIPFSSLKGKWILINFWASWCRPCLDEIVELNHFYESHQKKVALFAVNFDDLSVSEQLPLIKKLDIRYPSLAEDPSEQLGLGHISGVPATFVFDPQGNLTDTLYGGQTLTTLNRAIHKQLY